MKTKLLTFTLSLIMFSGAFAQNVNIPDANFKAYLVGNASINTNGDSEIQVGEAQAYTGWINCPNMNISSLTGIEAFTNFNQLYCNNNQISGTIDLSNSPNVTVVWCGSNLISGLNLSANTALIDLRCSTNPNLTSLDLSNNSALQVFMATTTMITAMDLSNNPALNQFNMQSSNLSSLNIQNGNNSIISSFNCTQNPNLTCIQVDDIAFSTTYWTNKPPGASYSTDCQCNSSSSITIPNSCGSYTAPDGQEYSQTGNYVAIIPNAAGCDSIISIDLQQIVFIYPYIEHSVNNGVHSLLYNYGGDFQWVDCNNNYAPIPGETSNFFTPTVSGLYALEITTLGCTLISDCEPVTVNNVSLETYEAQQIHLYPNPATEQLTIELSQPTEIFIMDALGNVVHAGAISSNHTLNVAHFAQGVYFIKAGNTTQRFVKQ